MLCSVKQLNGWKLAARDGVIGHAREVYFDDEHWVVRHVVVDTGGWLSGHPVLISPHSIEALEAYQETMKVALTRRQIEEAPGIDTQQPVSRQQEAAFYDYYGYPYYWTGTAPWGVGAYPLSGRSLPMDSASGATSVAAAEAMRARRQHGDAHLRSSGEVVGYHIEATDGQIGHIEDFLFDDRSWEIRFAIADTRNWLPGRLALVSTRHITSVDWPARRIQVGTSREAIRNSPPYEKGVPVPEERARQAEQA